MTKFSDEMIEDLAKVINGPHDATHIGVDELKELQQVRWDRQTTKIDKAMCRNQARAVLEHLEVPAAMAVKEPNVAKLLRAAKDLLASVGKSKLEKTSPVFQVRVSDLAAAVTALTAATQEEDLDNDNTAAPGLER
jgi:hypothetical protein